MGLNGQTLTGSGSDSVIKIENGGSLTLADSGSGGKITRSNPMTGDGGGVYVAENGTFTMTGDSIVGCTASDGAGIYLVGTLYANGGTVENTVTVAALDNGGGTKGYGQIKADSSESVTTFTAQATVERHSSSDNEVGKISSGTFTEPVTNNEGGKITGGDFAGEITGSGDVSFSDSTSLYTVKFTVDGADCDKRCVTSTNIKISKPSNPTKEGYTFAQWAMKDGKEWNFDKSIADNVGPTVPTEVVLTAKWTINQYTVTFDTNGGSAVDPQTVDYDERVTEPAAPTKTGYTFAGWYNGDKK